MWLLVFPGGKRDASSLLESLSLAVRQVAEQSGQEEGAPEVHWMNMYYTYTQTHRNQI